MPATSLLPDRICATVEPGAARDAAAEASALAIVSSQAACGTIDRDRVFDATLHQALRYLWFHDTPQRWACVLDAVACQDELLAALK